MKAYWKVAKSISASLDRFRLSFHIFELSDRTIVIDEDYDWASQVNAATRVIYLRQFLALRTS